MSRVYWGILFFFLFLSGTLRGQDKCFIKGIAVDTTAKVKLSNAAVAILSAQDSILVSFTWAVKNGSFQINNLVPGKYLLVIYYPDYADYVEEFNLNEITKSHDFNEISMIPKARLLKEVIIKGTAVAIKIKGDTTEFNARSYVIQPNDKVEDLIKQLPGIQVDSHGTITAEGKIITKVLLDGEEFFGDDPTLVTRNIRADMVDKVQLFNKKSDQATFTGIDDGIKTKTLNIKLKENKRNGYFGKVEGGKGTDGYYEGQGMYNRFEAKDRISVYSTISNNGKTGLSQNENQKYTDVGFDTGGEVLDYNNQGIPEAKTGGAHYDGKWEEGKQSLNTNYRIGFLNIKGTINTLTQNNIPNGLINTDAEQNFNNSVLRQKFDATYRVKIDNTSDLKITTEGTDLTIKTNDNFSIISRRGNETLLNENSRELINDAHQKLFNTSVFYTKKLKKGGRTFSILMSGFVKNTNTFSSLWSGIKFYNNIGLLDSTEQVNQHTINNIENTIFNSNITYTEPFSKSISLILNYGVNINNNKSDIQTYNPSTIGEYNILVAPLSSDLKLNQFSNQLGAIVSYKKGKTIFSAGTKTSEVAFNQINKVNDDVFKRHFLNWYPQATYKYEFSEQKSLEVYYDGNTIQPSINQLQPVQTNTDPLNIYIGNQNLKPSFTNRLAFYYNSYKVLNNKYFTVNGTFSYISNQITNNTSTNSSGKSATQYVNLYEKKPFQYSLFASLAQNIGTSGVVMGPNFNVTGNTFYSYINNVISYSNTAVYQVGFNLHQFVQKKFDYYVLLGPTFSINQSSLQPQFNGNGGGLSAKGNFNIYLPFKFQIASDIYYTYVAKTETFQQNLNRMIWNITMSKAFFKDNSIKASVIVNDLLNQNVGFERSANGNMIVQNSYNTIRRYFLFSISWDFNKVGQTNEKK